MAKITSVTVGQSENGTAVVTSGQLTGPAGRQIVITAQPREGYRLSRWEVQTTPVQLEVFAAVASRPVQTLTEVCGTNARQSDWQRVAIQLYSDETALYTDPDGNNLAPYGYWGAGNDTYYLWTGGRKPTLQACTYGGDSGGNTGTGGGGKICYNAFGVVVPCDNDKKFT